MLGMIVGADLPLSERGSLMIFPSRTSNIPPALQHNRWLNISRLLLYRHINQYGTVPEGVARSADAGGGSVLASTNLLQEIGQPGDFQEEWSGPVEFPKWLLFPSARRFNCPVQNLTATLIL